MKNKSLFIASIIIIAVSSIVLWRSEWFQREVFPEKYWQQKVNELESSIKIQEYVIRDTRLELAKKIATFKLDIAQEINLAELTGTEKEEYVKNITDEKRTEIENVRKSLNMMEAMLLKTKNELLEARNRLDELKKHK